MTIRKASINDLQFLVDLFENYRLFYNEDADKKRAIGFLSERLTLKDSEIFVSATGDNNLTGFMQLYPLFSSIKMKRLWLLNDLFVDIEYRGKGISKQLIENAKDHCLKTNASGLILETEKKNMIGNELYPKVGFSKDDIHNYYFWNNESIEI